MRTLTDREKRTLRIGAVGITAYLLLFGGFQGARYFAQRRAEYQKLLDEASRLKQEVRLYEDKVLVIRKLMEGFHMDPAKLSRASVVAQSSAAIQKAALAGGIQVGPVRESPARPSAKELASVQLEAAGPVRAVMGFLHQMEGVGYPLIIDAVQITSDTTRPGQIKLNLTIVILDFDQWKKEELPHA
jgi:hypothetical protein